MTTHLTYLWIDLGSFIIPFLFSFHPKLNFHKKFNAFIKANLIVSVLFILWDILFTHLQVWGFNPKYISGLHLINLPVEEILFFLFIPFSSLFTYHCFHVFFTSVPGLSSRIISVPLILVSTWIALLHYNKLYTVSAFGLVSLLIIFLEFINRKPWLMHFYRMYLIILLPFFIVNGMLTGTGLKEPVVIYNDLQNLGIRLFTIPVEDVFYGLSLLLLNTACYEHFISRGEIKLKS